MSRLRADAPADALLGREPEQARVAAFCGGVAAGTGGALVLAGAPGMGKTALLRTAGGSGLRVLDIAGAESEVDLPFAALAVVLEPLMPHAAALAPPARAALAGAVGGGAPAATDAVQVLHAATALLGIAAADGGPLLLRVDDLQWLDPSSQQAVAFIARRAKRIGVGLLGTWSLRDEPVPAWVVGEGLVALDALPRHQAIALAERHGVAPSVALGLVDAVGGTPLALVELARHLPADVRAGRDPLPDPLPLGPRLHQAYGARVGALPAATRHALLVAATSSDGAPAPLRAVLGDLDALAPAEDAGLITVTPQRVGFRHPLVRTAVRAAATPTARRAAHRALASAITGPERAWHLAAAATGPDEGLAGDLEALGYEAQRRGAPATASAALERAAHLTPNPEGACRRTVAAAGLALVAGTPARARALLDAALPAVTDEALRADVQLLRGAAIQQAGSPMAAFALLEQAAERVREQDPARAAALLTQAGIALVAHGPMDRLAALAERALQLAPAEAELVPAVFHASALASLGQHARARVLLRERHAALRALDPVGPGHEILAVAALCHLWMEDVEEAEALLTWLIATGRERGAVVALAFPLNVLASVQLRRGAFDQAAALSAEAVALGEDAVGSFLHSVSLTTAAFVAANRGDADACAAHAEQARALGLRLELTSTLAGAEQALGFLALGAGRPAVAVTHLERAREHARRFGSRDPSFLYTEADLAEALVRAGREGEAHAVVDELAAGAATTGGAWAAAATARCRMLLDDDAHLDAHLAAALAAHERIPYRFELARTHLCAGERLRRARRRADARAHLTVAHTTFAALGANPWAARAAHELRATGMALGHADALTERERAVCDLVAGGATNREAAAALYVSTRTVEHHLRMAYRKLGVRSRTELTGRWPVLGSGGAASSPALADPSNR